MANSVDPGAVCSGSTLFASILKLSVMLGKYLQQMTSADNIFRCMHFFLGSFSLPPLHYSVDFIFLSFGIMGFIWGL